MSTSRCHDVCSSPAGDPRDRDRRARSPARSLRPSGRPLAPRFGRHRLSRLVAAGGRLLQPDDSHAEPPEPPEPAASAALMLLCGIGPTSGRGAIVPPWPVRVIGMHGNPRRDHSDSTLAGTIPPIAAAMSFRPSVCHALERQRPRGLTLALAPLLAGLAQRVTRSPLAAGIIGAGRSWTACTISVLSMPRKYTDVIPRSACWICG